jgi:beta-lactamase class A
MLRCQTGERRLKGDLPASVEVAHKTGTIGGTVNDAGVIFLPYNRGQVVIVVFTKNTDNEKTEDVERVIAQIARFVYDYFLFGE